eukprot:4407236-Amphidinium_carterae.1
MGKPWDSALAQTSVPYPFLKVTMLECLSAVFVVHRAKRTLNQSGEAGSYTRYIGRSVWSFRRS